MESIRLVLFPFLAVLLWLLVLVRVDAHLSPAEEVAVLLNFRHDMQYYHEDFNGYWKSCNKGDDNACAWIGVPCSTNCNVMAFDFSDWGPHYIAGLSELSKLPDFVQLDTSYNRLYGEKNSSAVSSGSVVTNSIPDVIGSFTNLTWWDLSFNNFTGLIPQTISSSRKLRYLSVESNHFSDAIPNLSDLSKLVDLQFLLLADSGLSGSFPKELGELSSLFALDVSRNNLSGNIFVANAPNLRNFLLQDNSFVGLPMHINAPLVEQLVVSGNQLKGMIAVTITKLAGLNTLNMSHSLLSGKFPSGLCSNKNLIYTEFSQNQLSGPTPIDLLQASYDARYIPINSSYNFLSCTFPTPTNFPPGDVLLENCTRLYLSRLTLNWSYVKALNLSNNNLSCSASESISNPVDAALKILSRYSNSSAFWVGGNNSATGPPFQEFHSLQVLDFNRQLEGVISGYPLPQCHHPGTGVQWWILVIIVGESITIAIGSCFLFTWRWRVYHKRHEHDADLIRTLMERELVKLMPLRNLKKATDDFAERARIGEGGYGTVYVGKLNDGTMVAIKRSKREGSENDKKQFLNEVRILSQVNHRHLVKLMGCCMENKVALLVFEFVANGTLQDHLQRKLGDGHLSWEQRLDIAVQTADALNYLHSATVFPIYHRDVKSANILLSDDLSAKVADFGISKLAPMNATHVSTALQGTVGYIDPEYWVSFQLTEKSDVYSFGVVLLELISAKLPVDFQRGGEETSLVIFASPHIAGENLLPLIDPCLMGTYDELYGNGKESILDVGRLAMKCVNMHSKFRPSMNEVWKELQGICLKLNGTFRNEDSGSLDSNGNENPRVDHEAVLSQLTFGDSSNCVLHSDDTSLELV